MSAWGIDVSGGKRESLRRFVEVLADYERANVIGTRDPDRVLLDHVLDSLSCFLFRPVAEARKLSDVGSGGGLPGVPLQIVGSGTATTLFESTGKKAEFLRHALREVGVPRTRVVHGRVEEAAHLSEHRSAYDICTARAVARLSIVAEYCVPLVKVGGRVVAMKGKPDKAEIKEGERAAKLLGARISEVIKVPFLREVSEKERRVVVLEKVSQTPGIYPRAPGVPAKSPLRR